MVFESDGKNVTSAFNSGVFQIQRLHDLWLRCNDYSRNGDFRQWRWCLDTVWRELSDDAAKDAGIKPGEFEKLGSNPWAVRYAALDGAVQAALLTRGYRLLYLSLRDLEIFLRYLQDHVGKGSKRKDVDEDSFD